MNPGESLHGRITTLEAKVEALQKHVRLLQTIGKQSENQISRELRKAKRTNGGGRHGALNGSSAP